MIDVRATLEEISRLEKLQAQLELRAAQIKEDEKKLKDKLKTIGVTPAELERKIAETEAAIESMLTMIRGLNNPTGGNGEEEGSQEEN